MVDDPEFTTGSNKKEDMVEGRTMLRKRIDTRREDRTDSIESSQQPDDLEKLMGSTAGAGVGANAEKSLVDEGRSPLRKRMNTRADRRTNMIGESSTATEVKKMEDSSASASTAEKGLLIDGLLVGVTMYSDGVNYKAFDDRTPPPLITEADAAEAPPLITDADDADVEPINWEPINNPSVDHRVGMVFEVEDSKANPKRKKVFFGRVVKFLKESKAGESDELYHVEWEDGDEQDLDNDELVFAKKCYKLNAHRSSHVFGKDDEEASERMEIRREEEKVRKLAVLEAILSAKSATNTLRQDTSASKLPPPAPASENVREHFSQDDDPPESPPVPRIGKPYTKNLSEEVVFTRMQRMTRTCVSNGIVRQSYRHNVDQSLSLENSRYIKGERVWLKGDFDPTKLPLVGLKVAVFIPDVDFVKFTRLLVVDDQLSIGTLFRDPQNPKLKWELLFGTVIEYSSETAPGKEDDLFLVRWDTVNIGDKRNDWANSNDKFTRAIGMNAWMRKVFRQGDDTDRNYCSSGDMTLTSCYNIIETHRAVTLHYNLSIINPDYSFLIGTQVDPTDGWMQFTRSDPYLGKKVATMFPDIARSKVQFYWKLFTGVVTHVQPSLNPLTVPTYAVTWDEEDAMKCSHIRQRFTHEVWGFRQECGNYDAREISTMITFYNEKATCEGAIPVRQRLCNSRRMDRLVKSFGDVRNGIHQHDKSDYTSLICEIYNNAIHPDFSVHHPDYADRFKIVRNFCPVKGQGGSGVCGRDHVCDKQLSISDMYRNCFSGKRGSENRFVTRVDKIIIVIDKGGFVIDPFTGIVTSVWIELSELGEVIDIKFDSNDKGQPHRPCSMGLKTCVRTGEIMRSCATNIFRVPKDLVWYTAEGERILRDSLKVATRPFDNFPTKVVMINGIGEFYSWYDQAAESESECSESESENGSDSGSVSSRDYETPSSSKKNKAKAISRVKVSSGEMSSTASDTQTSSSGMASTASSKKGFLDELKNFCVKHGLSQRISDELQELARPLA